MEVGQNYFAKQNSQGEEKEQKSKSLKLPKCPGAFMNKQTMLWIEPLGLWVPLHQVSQRPFRHMRFGRESHAYVTYNCGYNRLGTSPPPSIRTCVHPIIILLYPVTFFPG